MEPIPCEKGACPTEEGNKKVLPWGGRENNQGKSKTTGGWKKKSSIEGTLGESGGNYLHIQGKKDLCQGREEKVILVLGLKAFFQKKKGPQLNKLEKHPLLQNESS